MIKKEPRLQSLDIFRGFTIAAMILVNTPGDWNYIYPPLEHSKWNGCTPTDLVFPSFLFMAGVSIVFALQKKRAEAALHKGILVSAFRRMLLLIVIGLSIQLIYRWDFQHLRFPGVLQRIAVVYFISTLLYLKFSSRALNYIFAFALIGYYIIMTFVPVPDGHLPNLEPATNMAAYIDRWVFSVDHLYKPSGGIWDPVGLLSTLPAIGTTLFGVKVGVWLKRTDLDPRDKTIGLFIAGILAIVAGLIMDLFFPINKSLWTSSYVLYSAGICTVGFTLTYWFVDLKNRGKGLWPFLVFGTNAISAYILSEVSPGLIDLLTLNIHGQRVSGMKLLYSQLFLPFFSPQNASLLSAVCFVLFIWLLMLPLYRKHIIIKL